MTQITLSKSTYLKEARKLANYQRYLPPLDLKRQQLLTERNKAQSECRRLERELAEAVAESVERLPMIANNEIALEHLVRIEKVEIERQNLLGVALPRCNAVVFASEAYGYLTQPHWVDTLVVCLRRCSELKLRARVARQRLELLNLAVRKATQRVNLVAKILIPEAAANMRKIGVFLADNERAAVVRSKIAKKKHQASPGPEASV